MTATGSRDDVVRQHLAPAHFDAARFRQLADAMPIGTVLSEEPSSLSYVNDAWRQITGYEGPLPLPLADAVDLLHPEDRDEIARGLIEGLARDGTYAGRGRSVRPDGTVRWVDLRAQVLPDDQAPQPGFVGSLVDVTELVEARQAMARSETRFRELLVHSPVAQAIFDADGAVVHANPAYADLLGTTVDALRGVRTLALLHPDDRLALERDMAQMVSGAERVVRAEVRIQRADGTWRWIDSAGTAISDQGDGGIWSVAAVDVTDQRHDQERLRELAAIVETTTDLVGTLDPQTGELLYLNPAARAVYGHGPDDELAVTDLYSPDALRRYAEEILPTISRGEPWNGELEMRRSDGAPLQVWQTMHAERTADGRVSRVSAVGRDVTARRQAEAHLEWQATHDALTGLPNRSLLLEEMDRTLASRGPTGAALMFLDLDRFKSVNDTLGHDAGDELLVEVATRIESVVRPEDVVARLGGDEFVVLCRDVADDGHARAVAQRVLEVIEAEPFLVDDVELGMSASIGIALPATGEHAEGLLRDADAAMYRAKENGRARLELFDEVMRRRSSGRVDLAEQLSDAIEEGDITVLYQPLVDLETGRTTGVEALARWQHPERGLLAPDEFIGLAEDTGLILGLGLSVLEQACSQGARWLEALGPERAPQVHINLSARQLSQSNLPTLVGGTLDRLHLPATHLCLEITESVLMEDAPTAATVLTDLKDIGLDLAIDDFGTGYSSLSYLRRFPVDVLKVDRSFIDGLGDDPEDSAIVAAVVNLAHTLELRAVAEGVETDAQLGELRTLGCDAAQGYLFSKPVGGDELTAHLLGPDEP